MKLIQIANYFYSGATDKVYLGLFGYTCKDLKAKLGLDEKDSFRDALQPAQLDFIADVESLAARLIDCDRLSPVAAVQEALRRLMIPVQLV